MAAASVDGFGMMLFACWHSRLTRFALGSMRYGLTANIATYRLWAAPKGYGHKALGGQ